MSVGVDEVVAGRPAPWMMFRVMTALNVVSAHDRGEGRRHDSRHWRRSRRWNVERLVLLHWQ